MAEKYISIDKVEPLLDAGKVIGRLITDKAGETHKIKKGQRGKLEARWEELDAGEGRAIKLIMAKYKPPGQSETFDFVADFEFVEDVFVQQATEKVQATQVDTKDRAVALSYAKDLVIADKIPLDNIFNWADKFYTYIQGKETIMGVVISEEKVPVKKEEQGDDVIPTTRQELMAWAKSQGKMPSWVCEQLGVKTPSEIADIPGAYDTLREKIEKEE